MKLLVRNEKLKCFVAAYIFAWMLCCQTATATSHPDIRTKEIRSSVKKDIKSDQTTLTPPELSHNDEVVPTEAVLIISEKTLEELQAKKNKSNSKETAPTEKTKAKELPVIPNSSIADDVPIAASHMQIIKETEQKTFYHELLDSYWLGILVFPAIAFVIVLHLMLKYQRMRAVHRSERKYGVQGNRTTQELTPLPIYIEDGNSDDEDQTIFDINSREQIRIL